MTNTYLHAEIEMDILSKSNPDPNNRPIIEPFKDEILALCEKFGNSGQSGGSAPYTATAISQAIKKLLLQEPICPITGHEDEWVDITDMNGGTKLYQNKRCSAIFKDGNGDAYYLDAIIWKDSRGVTWSGTANLPNGDIVRSKAYIKEFPFTPKTYYIDIIDIEVKPDDWEFNIKNVDDLKKVEKHYKIILAQQ